MTSAEKAPKKHIGAFKEINGDQAQIDLDMIVIFRNTY